MQIIIVKDAGQTKMETLTQPLKCINCGEELFSTSRSCEVWNREKDIVAVKYRESLSFAEARKIVDARQTLGASYSSIAKATTPSRVN